MIDDGLLLPVRWRKAGDPMWTPLAPAPGSNPGFREVAEFQFEKPGAGWSFIVDDEPLADASDPSCWIWKPGFYAGEVTAELIRPDGTREGLALLDVSPDEAKLGRELFTAMLDALVAEAPSLAFGTEPAHTAIGELGRFADPWLSFSRLRRFGPEFIRALKGVADRPRRALRIQRRDVPAHKARRVDRQTAMAAQRSTAVSLFAERGFAEGIDPARLRLDVPSVQDTVDCAANRAMQALTIGVLRRARLLREELDRAVAREAVSETRTSLARRWPIRRDFLDRFGNDLSRILRRLPWLEVGRAEITAAGLTGVAADPMYSRAWGRGWRALRSGIESGEPVERLWVSPSWEVYERWCFLQIGKILMQAHPEWGWRRLDAPDHQWVGSFDGRRATLMLQPTFRSTGRPAPRWSISRQREPDLVLAIGDGPDPRFVVLDAKYRQSQQNVLDAMASAHIYQDSLRMWDRRPEASLLLVPAGGGAPWLESPAFQVQHRVGVHVLSPGAEEVVPWLLTECLASPCPGGQ